MTVLIIAFLLMSSLYHPMHVEYPEPDFAYETESSDDEFPSYSLDLPLDSKEPFGYGSLDNIFQTDPWYEEPDEDKTSKIL